MLTDERLSHLYDFVRQYLEETAASSEQEWIRDFPRTAEYRWRHTLNVLRNAEKILAGEEAEDDAADVVRVAAILHDVSMFVCDHAVHGRVSAEIGEQYLLKQGYPEEFVRRVARAVAEHGTDLGPLSPEEQGALFSWEGKVLVEADILDKLGASAIANALLYLGTKGRLPHECVVELAEGRAMERATFFKDYIWTETGKRMAAERYGFFLRFQEQLAEEVVASPGFSDNRDF